MDSKSTPIDQKHKTEQIISWIVTALMVTASAASLIFRSKIYSSEELEQSFIANDIVNLLIGAPVLLAAIYLVRSKRFLGLLLWPGALFYAIYNYLVYLLSLPFSFVYIFYPVIVVLSGITLFRLLTSIDGDMVRAKVGNAVPVNLYSGVMVFIGIAFSILAINKIGNYLIGQVYLSVPEIALNVTDIIFSLVWIICGLAFWRRKILGYLTILGLLYQVSMLFIALILVVTIQPFIMNEPLAVFDLIVLAVMSLIVILPFLFFILAVQNIQARR